MKEFKKTFDSCLFIFIFSINYYSMHCQRTLKTCFMTLKILLKCSVWTQKMQFQSDKCHLQIAYKVQTTYLLFILKNSISILQKMVLCILG